MRNKRKKIIQFNFFFQSALDLYNYIAYHSYRHIYNSEQQIHSKVERYIEYARMQTPGTPFWSPLVVLL